jgi:hypothetical protein
MCTDYQDEQILLANTKARLCKCSANAGEPNESMNPRRRIRRTWDDEPRRILEMSKKSEIASRITPKRLPKAHLFKISDVVVGTRHRRDMGDIDALAASIKDIGLLHPIVVRPNGVLVAGERRLRAAKMLGWTEIPVNIIDLEAVTRGEFAENAVRKDFTLSDAVAIKRALEPLEKVAAKERQRAAGGSKPGKRGGGGNRLGQVATSDKGKAADKAAKATKATGMARRTLEKAEAIRRCRRGRA